MDEKKKKETPKIDIFKLGKACGICVLSARQGALAKDEAGNPYVKILTNVLMRMVQIRCPDFAITVETKAKGSKG